MAENNYIASSGRAVCSALCLVDSSDTTLAVVCICGRQPPRVKAPGHPTPVLEFNCIPLSPCLVDRGDTTHAVVRISGQQSSREKAPGHLVDGWLKCCFTSTETVGLLGTGAQNVHLDFHTAPELCGGHRSPV